MIGVYKIIINEKAYVGSSINIKLRWRQHKSDLKCNRHNNPHLQAAYNKYKDIKFEMIEIYKNISQDDLRLREKFWKDKIGYYNIQDPITTCQKEIYQFDLKGNFIRKYTSSSEAADVLHISVSNIVHAAQENEKWTRTAGGFFWRYTPTLITKPDKRRTPMCVYTIDGDFIREFESIVECTKTLFPNEKYAQEGITNVCEGICASYRGFRFSKEKLEKLDNSKLLKIKKGFPVVQLTLDKKYKIKVWATAAMAAKELKTQSCSITQACVKDTVCKNYRWTRLGTKLSELPERPEDLDTKAELETINVNV